MTKVHEKLINQQYIVYVNFCFENFFQWTEAKLFAMIMFYVMLLQDNFGRACLD